MTVQLASIEDIVFHVSNALRIPVLVAALVALALVLVELGALAGELIRRRRGGSALAPAARAAREALSAGDVDGARRALLGAATSPAMRALLAQLVAEVSTSPPDASVLAKSLADFDLGSLRRLERTRLLVRAGPALGLMGTLIPLSPALNGLANGNLHELTSRLRVAFSVTVLGLLVGVIAFGISLVRDRLYAQDLSDAQFVVAQLEAARESAA